MNPIVKAFARNRAEEIGEDLWEDFVVPLYYDKLPLGETRKPLVIVGGRGCGKTTLLRYLSHRSQFSKHRHDEISTDSIGLYLRADTQFLRLFQGNELDQKGWMSAFGHFLALALSSELLDAVQNLNATEQRRNKFGGMERVDLSTLHAFDTELPTTIPELARHLKLARLSFATWLNNSASRAAPTFYSYKEFVVTLIEELRQQLPYLSKSDVFVFIDEYENLLEYQQQLINTAIKHSEPPLIFNIAMKRRGMRTSKTVGGESIQHIADYRQVDIEDLLEQHNFPLFAAELFFFRLEQQGIGEDAWPINTDQLRATEEVAARRDNPAYVDKVLSEIRRVLPGCERQDLAREILEDDALRRRLLRWIDQGLKRRATKRAKPLAAEQFIQPSQPMASLICGALVNQDSKSPEDILVELQKRVDGQPSDFYPHWEHTYLVGSVLYIYATLQRPCPLYAGFKAFVALSRFNARHFLELCHSAIVEATFNGKPEEFQIPVAIQARAARRASSLLIEEIQGFGDRGNRLHTMVATLGQIFQLSQQRPSQSETERTHFALRGESVAPTEWETLSDVLSEAIKWSVLFGENETKVKSARFEQMEYVLNPIYAPHFGVSYNKGRKLEFTSEQAQTLLSGDHKALTALIQAYQRMWFRDAGNQLLLLGDK